LAQLFAMVERARILCVTKNGLNGCHFVNRFMSDYLAEQMGSLSPESTAYRPGSFILVTRNAPGLDLYNGDLGILVNDHQNNIWACFRRGGAYMVYSQAQLPPWELGFATTVHKSQGSEFANVLLAMPENEDHRLLSREILYTGVTRAQKRLIIYGGRGGIQNALKSRIDRESGFLHAALAGPSDGSLSV
jgi:exodeoxyribonuclease V alpha subunit